MRAPQRSGAEASRCCLLCFPLAALPPPFSYTHRPGRSGAHEPAGSGVDLPIPQNSFVWRLLKMGSRARAGGGRPARRPRPGPTAARLPQAAYPTPRPAYPGPTLYPPPGTPSCGRAAYPIPPSPPTLPLLAGLLHVAHLYTYTLLSPLHYPLYPTCSARYATVRQCRLLIAVDSR